MDEEEVSNHMEISLKYIAMLLLFVLIGIFLIAIEYQKKNLLIRVHPLSPFALG
jgi:hypothetical protein